MSSKNKKTSFLNIIVVAVAFIFVLIFAIFLNKKINQSLENNQNTTNVFSTIDSLFTQAEEKENGKIDASSNSDFRWITVDGYQINLPNSLSVKLMTYDQNCDNGEMFQRVNNMLAPAIEKQLLVDGWIKNESNSMTAINQENYLPYTQAYENDEFIALYLADYNCTANSQAEIHNNQTHNEFEFVYAKKSELEKNYQEQISFLRDLQIEDAAITQIKREGDWARLEASNYYVGWQIVAKLVDGHWAEILATGDLAECQTLTANQIPATIMGVCYDEKSGETICLPDSQETVCLN